MKAFQRATGLCLSLFCFSSIVFADQMVKGSVEKNVDGDTIWVQSTEWSGNGPRERLKIRMVGIDAPESHLPTSEGVVSQGEFGELAAEAMMSLAPVGTKVTVQDKGLDKYSRTLGRVLIQKKDINLEMVRVGWAIPYIICEGPACDENFLETENAPTYFKTCESARQKGLGIFDPKTHLRKCLLNFV